MPNIDNFKDKLERSLDSNLTAKELAERIVLAALESEYGKSFTLSAGFAKMVNTLADSIVTNPELRRQALAVASFYVKKNSGNKKDLTKIA
ncbi:MAG: hypothetical protein ABIH22_01120 [Candidatus Margulisiibacteriota bacterium]